MEFGLIGQIPLRYPASKLGTRAGLRPAIASYASELDSA